MGFKAAPQTYVYTAAVPVYLVGPKWEVERRVTLGSPFQGIHGHRSPMPRTVTPVRTQGHCRNKGLSVKSSDQRSLAPMARHCARSNFFYAFCTYLHVRYSAELFLKDTN